MTDISKHYYLWKNLNTLRKQCANLTKNNIGHKSQEYQVLVDLLKTIPLKYVNQFLTTVFQTIKIDTGYVLEINIDNHLALNFLTSFILNYFPKDTLCEDTSVLYSSKRLVEKYDIMINNTMQLKHIHCFGQSLISFVESYRLWETREKYQNIESEIESEIESIAQSFWESCANIYQNLQNGEIALAKLNTLKDTGETHYENAPIDDVIQNVNETIDIWKTHFQNGFQNLKDKTLAMVKSIGGESAVKSFESFVPIFIDPSFNDSIRELVHRAFWESLELDISKKKFDKLVSLMKELKIYLMKCVPSRNDIHHEINTAIDIDLWDQMLTHDAYNVTDIKNLINYVYSKLEAWSANQENDELKSFRTELDKQLKTIQTGELTMSKYVAYFLQKTFQFLEKIIIGNAQFKLTHEYQQLKTVYTELTHDK